MQELTCALGPDSAGTVLADAIGGARSTLDAAMYEVGPSYRWLLVRAARRGVRVRLILDAHRYDGNLGTARALLAAGGECRLLGTDSHQAHWKLLIVDGARLAVGTGNLIWRDAPRDTRHRLPPDGRPLRGTREWWTMVDGESTSAGTAAAAFEAAWGHARPASYIWEVRPAEAVQAAVGIPLPQVPPLVLPAASGSIGFLAGAEAVAGELASVVSSASRRLLVTVPYVHPHVPEVRSLLDGMQRADGRGCDVRLLLGAPPERRDAEALRALAFEARVMDPVRNTRGHAKGAVNDTSVLVTSSNWSRAGLALNWEAALLVCDAAAAAYYASAFNRDWLVSQPLGSAVSAQQGGDMLALHER